MSIAVFGSGANPSMPWFHFDIHNCVKHVFSLNFQGNPVIFGVRKRRCDNLKVETKLIAGLAKSYSTLLQK